MGGRRWGGGVGRRGWGGVRRWQGVEVGRSVEGMKRVMVRWRGEWGRE